MGRIFVTIDVWGVSSSDPRGIVNLKRQYAKANALLAESGEIRLCYAGTGADRSWLNGEGLLEGIEFRSIRIPGRLERHSTLMRFLPSRRLLGQPDIFHSFGLYPFNSKDMQVVGTLVDFVPLRVPEFVPLTFTAEQIRWCQWAADHPNARWVAISEQTRQDALCLGRIAPNQVSVVYPGVNDDMFVRPSTSEISSTLETLGISAPFMLCVNTLNPRKNHARLVKAWEKGGLAGDGWTLVLVGHAAGNPLAQQLQAQKYANVVWLGYVSRHQLRHLYYGCEIFVYPSLYEGYGIPVAEAVVAGKPVITTQRSSMAEIVGQNAIYIDPVDISNMASGLRQMIDDVSLRIRFAECSELRRQEFSLKHVARDLLAVYRSL